MKFINHLANLDACPKSLIWARNKTIEEAWKTCKNPQWMLWFLTRTDLDLIDPICDIAERVLHLVPEESQLACIWSISAARRRADQDELDAAHYAAYRTATTDSRTCSWYAARSASWVSYYAADSDCRAASWAASCASCASNAHVLSCNVFNDEYTAAYRKEEKKQCDILRKYFTIDQVREAFNKLVAINPCGYSNITSKA